jgi:hypothetical protein
LPYECDGDPADTPWRLGLSLSGFRTTIDLGVREIGLEQSSVVATVGRQWGPRWGLVGGVGLILGGAVTNAAGTDRETDVGVGGMITITGTWLVAFEQPGRPFVLLSATTSISTTTAVSDDGLDHRLTAGDLRAGVMVGKTFVERVVPYVAARAFGGPVIWTVGGEAVSGGDVHHYTLGGGLIVRLPAGRLDLFAEAMPLGEQSASAGVTASF